MLFELADVYDDYEEFDKVFDCLRLILEIEPTNEEALYKICFGPISLVATKRVSGSTIK